MHVPIVFWVAFNAFVLFLLVADLSLFHRKAHAIKFGEAIAWSIFWVALAAAFAIVVYWWHGKAAALEFTTGYLVEEALSADNLFIFLLIFRYFRVPGPYQHKVLFWGILGALIMRGLFILVGVGLIRSFHWVIYLFGIFLVYTGLKLLKSEEADVEPDKNLILRWVRKLLPVTSDYVGGKFWVQDHGLFATPLLLVLVVVETTDVMFAADSIPAVLAISRDPFIVYTSNVFAILGLRSLYFALAGMMEAFHHLHYGLSAILVFIGLKMLASDVYPIPTGIALSVVAGVLAITVATSLLFPKPRSQ